MSGDGTSTGNGRTDPSSLFRVESRQEGTVLPTEGATAKVIPIRQAASLEAPRRELRVEDVYPEREALSPALAGALRLLPEAADLADEAARHAAASEFIPMDDAVMRLKALLPELFACRAVGDGFGMIINAAHSAIASAQVVPFTNDQAQALSRAFRDLRARPLMNSDDGSRIVDRMEDAGLTVEPPGLGAIAYMDAEE